VGTTKGKQKRKKETVVGAKSARKHVVVGRIKAMWGVKESTCTLFTDVLAYFIVELSFIS
jgi:hypothetical protein